jgi:uncharacterized protein (TIGR03083 family)
VTNGAAFEPVDTSSLLVPIHRELVTLLRRLSPEQWLLPTRAGAWRVRDVAAHVLDGQLRRLSYHRDGLPRASPPADDDYASVVAFLNRLNAQWTEASERLSPRVLTDLLDSVGTQAAVFLASLPPHEGAFWPVAWAGESTSENWMDVGRDYTEYWHHQQQIRDAVGAPALVDPRWLTPVIALGVRALPRALADVSRPDGAVVRLEVRGDAGGRWSLVRETGGWALAQGETGHDVRARLHVDAEAAARLWYSGRRSRPARMAATCQGDSALCEAVLAARAVMV